VRADGLRRRVVLICGIHDGHNAAAALVRDGQLFTALQEGRLRRVKNGLGSQTWRFKLSSVRWALPGPM